MKILILLANTAASKNFSQGTKAVMTILEQGMRPPPFQLRWAWLLDVISSKGSIRLFQSLVTGR